MFEVLSGFRADKAPGLDGFSMSFWQFSWDFVKIEMMNFFKDFYEFGCFLRNLNSTFLVLIPKKGGGALYKWLAKALANRLKGVLAKVISKAQNAFVEGRQIMDAMFIANEAIDSILKSNEGVILCKLDIEKTYGHVEWSFSLSIMEKMGFGEKWLEPLFL